MKKVKRNVVIVTVLLFVCAAVYLNWSYNSRWGEADSAMVDAVDAKIEQANAQTELEDSVSTAVSEYFAQARLTRQTSRDEALDLLQTAVAIEGASSETIDSAMNAISVMANYSMEETQVENLLIAKNFADCVVYMSDDGVTVAVPAPMEGLSAADVARITETITSETNYDATQINVIEIKNNTTTKPTQVSPTPTTAQSPSASPNASPSPSASADPNAKKTSEDTGADAETMQLPEDVDSYD